MLTVRCFRCGTRFTLSLAALEEALAATADSRQKSYPVECIKCRQIIKVPVKELRRFRPRVAPAGTAGGETAPAEGAATEPGGEAALARRASAAEESAADEPAPAPEPEGEPPARPARPARSKRGAQKSSRPKAPRA